MQVLNENNKDDGAIIVKMNNLAKSARARKTTNLGTFTGTKSFYSEQKIIDWYAYLKRVETEKKIGMPMNTSVDNTNEVY
jgi:hypothetical protein